MRIAIDRDRCTGHGRCYFHAPELIADDEEGYGQVIGTGEVLPRLAASARKASAACPEHAVVVAEE